MVQRFTKWKHLKDCPKRTEPVVHRRDRQFRQSQHTWYCTDSFGYNSPMVETRIIRSSIAPPHSIRTSLATSSKTSQRQRDCHVWSDLTPVYYGYQPTRVMSRLYSPSWLSPTRRAVIITDRHVGLHNVTTGHMFSVFIFPTSKDEIARPLYSHTTFPRSNS